MSGSHPGDRVVEVTGLFKRRKEVGKLRIILIHINMLSFQLGVKTLNDSFFDFLGWLGGSGEKSIELDMGCQTTVTVSD